MSNESRLKEKKKQASYTLSVVYNKLGRIAITVEFTNLTRPYDCGCRKFILDVLDAHNRHRRVHGVPPLTLDSDLCEHAQEWAETSAAANLLNYRKRTRFGQNAIGVYSSIPNYVIPGNHPVDVWYDEMSDYKYGQEDSALGNYRSPHFTQVVWKGTKQLGVGLAKSDPGYTFIICFYYPPGNKAKEYAKNVQKPMIYEKKKLPLKLAQQLKDKIANFTIPKKDNQKIEMVTDGKYLFDVLLKKLNTVQYESKIFEKTCDTTGVKSKCVGAGKVLQSLQDLKPKGKLLDAMDNTQKMLEDILKGVTELEKGQEHVNRTCSALEDAKTKMKDIQRTINKIKDADDLADTLGALVEQTDAALHAIEIAEDESIKIGTIPSIIGALQNTTSDLALNVENIKEARISAPNIAELNEKTEMIESTMAFIKDNMDLDGMQEVFEPLSVDMCTAAIKECKEDLMNFQKLLKEARKKNSAGDGVMHILAKAGEILNRISELEDVTRAVKEAANSAEVKSKVEDVLRALIQVEDVVIDPNNDNENLSIITVAKNEMVEVLDDIKQVELKRERAALVPTMVKTVQDIVVSFDEVIGKPPQEIPMILNNLQQKTDEQFSMIQKLEEEVRQVKQISGVADRIKHASDRAATAIEKIFAIEPSDKGEETDVDVRILSPSNSKEDIAEKMSLSSKNEIDSVVPGEVKNTINDKDEEKSVDSKADKWRIGETKKDDGKAKEEKIFKEKDSRRGDERTPQAKKDEWNVIGEKIDENEDAETRTDKARIAPTKVGDEKVTKEKRDEESDKERIVDIQKDEVKSEGEKRDRAKDTETTRDEEKITDRKKGDGKAPGEKTDGLKDTETRDEEKIANTKQSEAKAPGEKRDGVKDTDATGDKDRMVDRKKYELKVPGEKRDRAKDTETTRDEEKITDRKKGEGKAPGEKTDGLKDTETSDEEEIADTKEREAKAPVEKRDGVKDTDATSDKDRIVDRKKDELKDPGEKRDRAKDTETTRDEEKITDRKKGEGKAPGEKTDGLKDTETRDEEKIANTKQSEAKAPGEKRDGVKDTDATGDKDRMVDRKKYELKVPGEKRDRAKDTETTRDEEKITDRKKGEGKAPGEKTDGLKDTETRDEEEIADTKEREAKAPVEKRDGVKDTDATSDKDRIVDRKKDELKDPGEKRDRAKDTETTRDEEKITDRKKGEGKAPGEKTDGLKDTETRDEEEIADTKEREAKAPVEKRDGVKDTDATSDKDRIVDRKKDELKDPGEKRDRAKDTETTRDEEKITDRKKGEGKAPGEKTDGLKDTETRDEEEIADTKERETKAQVEKRDGVKDTDATSDKDRMVDRKKYELKVPGEKRDRVKDTETTRDEEKITDRKKGEGKAPGEKTDGLKDTETRDEEEIADTKEREAKARVEKRDGVKDTDATSDKDRMVDRKKYELKVPGEKIDRAKDTETTRDEEKITDRKKGEGKAPGEKTDGLKDTETRDEEKIANTKQSEAKAPREKRDGVKDTDATGDKDRMVDRKKYDLKDPGEKRDRAKDTETARDEEKITDRKKGEGKAPGEKTDGLKDTETRDEEKIANTKQSEAKAPGEKRDGVKDTDATSDKDRIVDRKKDELKDPGEKRDRTKDTETTRDEEKITDRKKGEGKAPGEKRDGVKDTEATSDKERIVDIKKDEVKALEEKRDRVKDTETKKDDEKITDRKKGEGKAPAEKRDGITDSDSTRDEKEIVDTKESGVKAPVEKRYGVKDTGTTRDEEKITDSKRTPIGNKTKVDGDAKGGLIEASTVNGKNASEKEIKSPIKDRSLMKKALNDLKEANTAMTSTVDGFVTKIKTSSGSHTRLGKLRSILAAREECLSAHNHYRRLHKVPELIVSADVCECSQTWAEYLSRHGQIISNENHDYGENIYTTIAKTEKPQILSIVSDAVNTWYRKKKYYDFNNLDKVDQRSFPFTQVVWNRSQELGIGVAENARFIVVVCNYNPQGNLAGQFKRNVRPEHKEVVEFRRPALPVFSKTPLKRDSVVSIDINFGKEMVDCHNTYRKLHGVPMLRLSENLCRLATEWAKVVAKEQKLYQRPLCKYGTNLYASTSKVAAKRIVDHWYEHGANYDFSNRKLSEETGNFTQMIWKDSEQLGVGYATDDKDNFYVVVYYDPPGNVITKLKDNVFKQGGSDRMLSSNESAETYKSAISTLQPVSKEGIDSPANTFEQECLNSHNAFRKRHNVPPLSINAEMSAAAQSWAGILLLSTQLEHSGNEKYGENIFFAESTVDIKGADVVETWYNEIAEFEFASEEVNPATLHFSQLVWKASQQIGIGKASEGGVHYVVVNYFPRGNVMGQFTENVPFPDI